MQFAASARRGGRTGTPAACGYALAVSRTPVASSMRRSDQRSRPSAITCCRFSALKTLAIRAVGEPPIACVNVSAPGAALAGFQVSINGRIWVSTEVRRLELRFEVIAYVYCATGSRDKRKRNSLGNIGS
jgi:hypothetical protein